MMRTGRLETYLMGCIVRCCGLNRIYRISATAKGAWCWTVICSTTTRPQIILQAIQVKTLETLAELAVNDVELKPMALHFLLALTISLSDTRATHAPSTTWLRKILFLFLDWEVRGTWVPVSRTGPSKQSLRVNSSLGLRKPREPLGLLHTLFQDACRKKSCPVL